MAVPVFIPLREYLSQAAVEPLRPRIAAPFTFGHNHRLAWEGNQVFRPGVSTKTWLKS
jgi:hypothetical protein